MSYKYRPSMPPIDGPDPGPGAKVFLLALAVGVLIGALGSWFFLKPDPAPVPPVAVSGTELKTCQTQQAATARQLSQCQSNLKQLQTRVMGAAPSQFVPAIAVADRAQAQTAITASPPRPRPRPTAQPSPPPTPPVSTAPLAPPVPAAAPDNLAPVFIEPRPPATEWPQGIPAAPKPRPALVPPERKRTEVVRPDRESAVVPIEPAPQSAVPSRGEAAPDRAMVGAHTVDLKVGDEKNVTSNYDIRLVAVSRRKAGRYCVLAGNGMDSIRILSGTSQTVRWGTARTTLTATVQDSSSCRVRVQPAP